MDTFKSLGNKTEYHFQYDKTLLETFDNKHSDRDYWVKFNCPACKLRKDGLQEFLSVTDQIKS
jgi:NADPH-dependent 7-cyano-7-deazaguanine reductase QueF